MILLVLSFVAGVLTVLAPCTLPLLPVIVGTSVTGVPSRKKVFVVTFSLGLSIVVFTLLLKVSTFLISVPQGFWSTVSGMILILFGLISIFPNLWDSLPFVSKINRDSNKLLSSGYQKDNLLGDIIIGASLGPVFSSCSPTYFVILATVLPNSFYLGLIYLVVYALGVSLSLLAIAFVGQKIIGKLGGVSDTQGWFRRILGIIFLILGVFIILGIDKKIEKSLLNNGLFDITKIEQKLLRFNEKGSLVKADTNSEENTNIKRTHGPKAPEIVNPSGFINTGGQQLTISQFKDKKVILLDIWTYSCINCQRTLPYIKEWYQKYKDKGLVVIGLHTPEFAFEKVKSNVEKAVRDFGVTYPVVMDNDYSTWTAYGNQYWPRKYLINDLGEIVYDHIGEGNYEETEKAIQKALAELNGEEMDDSMSVPENLISVDQSQIKSPEVYFGSSRNEYLSNGKQGVSGIQNLKLPVLLFGNALYLEGGWDFGREYARSISSGKIVFKYSSKNVYMVASSDVGVEVTVWKDGEFEKKIMIKGNNLYTLIEGDSYGDHTLEVEVSRSGLEVFTLTFG